MNFVEFLKLEIGDGVAFRGRRIVLGRVVRTKPMVHIEWDDGQIGEFSRSIPHLSTVGIVRRYNVFVKEINTGCLRNGDQMSWYYDARIYKDGDIVNMVDCCPHRHKTSEAAMKCGRRIVRQKLNGFPNP